MYRKSLLALARLLLALCLAQSAAAVPASPASDAVFARVGHAVITLGELRSALRQGMRARFYHGRVSGAQLARFQRETGERLVERVLLLGEARRRGLEPDRKRVEKRLEAMRARLRSRPDWDAHRAEFERNARRHLVEESLLEALRAQVQAVPEPSPSQARAHYHDHPDQFTEPARARASLILLGVGASAPEQAWARAREDAARLVAQLRAGEADFATIARQRSADPSAMRGGDMGYLHRGMLSADAQKAIDGLSPGQITDPMDVLEGVAIFRLDERRPARLSPFERVADRARELWRRDARDAAWRALVEDLRRATRIELNESYYLPLTDGAGAEAGREAAHP